MIQSAIYMTMIICWPLLFLTIVIFSKNFFEECASKERKEAPICMNFQEDNSSWSMKKKTPTLKCPSATRAPIFWRFLA